MQRETVQDKVHIMQLLVNYGISLETVHSSRVQKLLAHSLAVALYKIWDTSGRYSADDVVSILQTEEFSLGVFN